MARRPDLVGLTVLAMLSVRAAHPYELHRLIVDTHKDYVTGLPRSLYHAVEKLAGQELITPVETAKEGRRPERTVYEITGEGRKELSSRLRALLETPHPDRRTFTAAISLVGALPPHDALGALRTRAAVIEGLLAGAEGHLRALRDNGLPEILMIEIDYDRSMNEADLAWVRHLITRLESKTLEWADTADQDLLPRSPDRP